MFENSKKLIEKVTVTIKDQLEKAGIDLPADKIRYTDDELKETPIYYHRVLKVVYNVCIIVREAIDGFKSTKDMGSYVLKFFKGSIKDYECVDKRLHYEKEKGKMWGLPQVVCDGTDLLAEEMIKVLDILYKDAVSDNGEKQIFSFLDNWFYDKASFLPYIPTSNDLGNMLLRRKKILEARRKIFKEVKNNKEINNCIESLSTLKEDSQDATLKKLLEIATNAAKNISTLQEASKKFTYEWKVNKYQDFESFNIEAGSINGNILIFIENEKKYYCFIKRTDEIICLDEGDEEENASEYTPFKEYISEDKCILQAIRPDEVVDKGKLCEELKEANIPALQIAQLNNFSYVVYLEKIRTHSGINFLESLKSDASTLLSNCFKAIMEKITLYGDKLGDPDINAQQMQVIQNELQDVVPSYKMLLDYDLKDMDEEDPLYLISGYVKIRCLLNEIENKLQQEEECELLSCLSELFSEADQRLQESQAKSQLRAQLEDGDRQLKESNQRIAELRNSGDDIKKQIGTQNETINELERKLEVLNRVEEALKNSKNDSGYIPFNELLGFFNPIDYDFNDTQLKQWQDALEFDSNGVLGRWLNWLPYPELNVGALRRLIEDKRKEFNGKLELAKKTLKILQGRESDLDRQLARELGGINLTEEQQQYLLARLKKLEQAPLEEEQSPVIQALGSEKFDDLADADKRRQEPDDAILVNRLLNDPKLIEKLNLTDEQITEIVQAIQVNFEEAKEKYNNASVTDWNEKMQEMSKLERMHKVLGRILSTRPRLFGINYGKRLKDGQRSEITNLRRDIKLYCVKEKLPFLRGPFYKLRQFFRFVFGYETDEEKAYDKYSIKQIIKSIYPRALRLRKQLLADSRPDNITEYLRDFKEKVELIRKIKNHKLFREGEKEFRKSISQCEKVIHELTNFAKFNQNKSDLTNEIIGHLKRYLQQPDDKKNFDLLAMKAGFVARGNTDTDNLFESLISCLNLKQIKEFARELLPSHIELTHDNMSNAILELSNVIYDRNKGDKYLYYIVNFLAAMRYKIEEEANTYKEIFSKLVKPIVVPSAESLKRETEELNAQRNRVADGLEQHHVVVPKNATSDLRNENEQYLERPTLTVGS